MVAPRLINSLDAMTQSISFANKLPKARKALAGVQFGGRMKIACDGDSNTAGLRSEGASTQLVTSSPPSVFAALLAKHFTVSRDNFWGGGGSNIGAAGLTAFDPRIVLGTGWADGVTGGNVGLGGGSLINNTNTTGALAFTPAGAWDKADLYTVSPSALPNFTADVGAVPTAFTPAQAVPTKSTFTPGSKAVQTINLKRVSGTNINHFAVDCYDSTVGHIAVWNIGHSGSRATEWADASTIFSKGQLIPLAPSDLAIICLGLNDWDNAVSIAAYAAAMQTHITRRLATGDAIIKVPAPPNTPNVAGGPSWSEYVAAMYGLAAANNLPLIDLSARFVDYATMNTLGFKTDPLHPNKLGYADDGLATYGLFMSIA